MHAFASLAWGVRICTRERARAFGVADSDLGDLSTELFTPPYGHLGCMLIGAPSHLHGQVPVCTVGSFGADAVCHSSNWHFLCLSLRKGSLIGRDEALLSIDGTLCCHAQNFRFPQLAPTAAHGGMAAVAAAPGGGRPGGGLRGYLGAFGLLNTSLVPAEMRK
eukprot:2367676-Pleurochrysis_carterae.AAC.1